MERECNICLKKVAYLTNYHCNVCENRSMEKWYKKYIKDIKAKEKR